MTSNPNRSGLERKAVAVPILWFELWPRTAALRFFCVSTRH